MFKQKTYFKSIFKKKRTDFKLRLTNRAPAVDGVVMLKQFNATQYFITLLLKVGLLKLVSTY